MWKGIMNFPMAELQGQTSLPAHRESTTTPHKKTERNVRPVESRQIQLQYWGGQLSYKVNDIQENWATK